MTDEVLYSNEWVSLRKITDLKNNIPGYVYSQETRCNSIIVSILPFRFIKDFTDIEYLLKVEMTPCWGLKPVLSTITGGFEVEITHDAIREIFEETGYIVKKEELIDLGTSYGTKSTDTTYVLFTVDLTGKFQEEARGEAGGLEGVQESKWVNRNKILTCKDPMASVALLRMEGKNYGIKE